MGLNWKLEAVDEVMDKIAGSEVNILYSKFE